MPLIGLRFVLYYLPRTMLSTAIGIALAYGLWSHSPLVAVNAGILVTFVVMLYFSDRSARADTKENPHA